MAVKLVALWLIVQLSGAIVTQIIARSVLDRRREGN
jgi:hypothetical protein